MIEDYSVRIKYKNRKGDYVGENVYPFGAYTKVLSFDLKRCLGTIEEAVKEIYKKCGKDDDENCDLREDPKFSEVRKIILDAANALERMPDTVCYKGIPISSCNAAEYISNLINNT